MKPYDNIEYLLDELSIIDLLIRNYLENLQDELPEIIDEFRGLYISEVDIQQIQRNPGLGSRQGVRQNIKTERLHEIAEIRKGINIKKMESLKISQELRLHTLSELFGLDSFEIDIILVGLAPELDLKYEKLFRIFKMM
jgi:hypothetical protein